MTVIMRSEAMHESGLRKHNKQSFLETGNRRRKTVMDIYLARHGETDWNIAKRVQGTTDTSLNENGIRQAERLYQNLKKDNIDLCRIYSSRQKRALTTARIVGAGYHVPVETVSGLEEMNFGLFEGHTWEEIATLYQDELKEWESDKRCHRTPGGESYQDVLERFFASLDRILGDVNDGIASGGDILLLTHGAVLMSLLTVKNDLDFATSYAVLDIENAKAIRLELSELREIKRKVYLDLD